MDSTDAAHALERLAGQWGRWYVITYENGIFHAERRDDGAKNHNPDPDELHREIMQNYEAWPVLLPS